MNLYACAKFGPDRFSGLEAFPDLWLFLPPKPPTMPPGLSCGTLFSGRNHSQIYHICVPKLHLLDQWLRWLPRSLYNCVFCVNTWNNVLYLSNTIVIAADKRSGRHGWWWSHRTLPRSRDRTSRSDQVRSKRHDGSNQRHSRPQLPCVPFDGSSMELLAGGRTPSVHPA